MHRFYVYTDLLPSRLPTYLFFHTMLLSYFFVSSQSCKHFNARFKFTCQFRKCSTVSWGFLGYLVSQLSHRMPKTTFKFVSALKLDSVYLMACHFNVKKVVHNFFSSNRFALLSQWKLTKKLFAATLHLS